MGAAIALSRFVPVKVIGCKMKSVFVLLLAAVAFDAASSSTDRPLIKEMAHFDDLVQEENPSTNQRMPHWLHEWANGNEAAIFEHGSHANSKMNSAARRKMIK